MAAVHEQAGGRNLAGLAWLQLQSWPNNTSTHNQVLVQVVAAVRQQAGGWDSARLAAHLERLARKGELGEGWQLALDMYTRLGMHDRHCQMLLSKVQVPNKQSDAVDSGTSYGTVVNHWC